MTTAAIARSLSPEVKVESQLRREFLVLTAVAFHDKPNISHLISDPALDWDYLLEAAKFHGLVPVLAPRLLRHVSLVPERVRLDLQESSRHALEGALALSGELVRVLRALNGAGVECIPFKGPALASQLWGNFTLRQSMDIDLLVRPSQMTCAVATLQSCGYTPKPQSGWQQLLPRAVELPLYKPGMPPLELQWGIAPKCFSVNWELEPCWQRAREGDFGGQSTLTFTPEDLLLILCIHGWKHAWNRLLWIADVARLINSATLLDWRVLEARAMASGIGGILSLGLLLAQRLFEISLPSEIETRLTARPQIARLAEESIGYMQRLDQPSYTGWHRYMLSAREKTGDRIRHITRFLITPGVGDWEAIRLPKFVSPLYRIVRLARVGQAAAQLALRRT